ncbi:MAG: hypothetical protein JO043_01730 [Candidatus Eremiobacteraeota bacterium]|nr:hypothetical protein [Candidatus Eremiobacteraeota bacterium]
MQYRSIGPAISGGRVSATAGSNRDPMLYYVGAAGGGVWKSSDGGISWQSVWKKQPLGAIGAVAIDPQNDAEVWVGTGEANPRNDVSWGDGMWRSRDGAKTWQHLGLEGTSQIARISIDPRDPSDVVVAALGDPWKDSAERGVFRTTDGGRSWRKTLYVSATSGAADLARDPKNARVLYAAMWHFRREPWYFTSGGNDDGLYKSVDGGATWRRISGGGFPALPLGRIGIAIAPSRPQRVYAVIQSREGTVWRSDDSGAHWLRVSSDTMPEQRPFYFSHLAVDPHNANRLISVSMYLSVSQDAGRTWKHLATNIHVDNHALWWSADGKRLLNGNDGGIAFSNDGGETWSMPLNLAIGQIYHVGYDLSDPYNVCGGFQDNSSWCGPSNSRNGIGILGRDWTAITGGDGTWALFDPQDPQRVWSDTQDGALTIFDRRAQQSIDVEPWPRDAFTSTVGLVDKQYRFNWNSPLAFSPQDPHVAYFGGNVVFRTRDSGRTWAPISSDLTRNEKAHQRASGGPVSLDVSGAEYYDTLLSIAPSPKDERVIWAGSDDGLVHLTRDGGGSWADVTPSALPQYARIECVEPAQDDAAAVYIAVDRHDLGDRQPYLFATGNFGATWRRIDAGLPRNVSSHVIRIDRRNPSILYVGTEQGVWYSTNRGAAWYPLKFNLPAVPVYDIQTHPKANDLILATHGRSFWILDDLTPIQDAWRIGHGPYLFAVRPDTLWAQWAPVEGGDQNSQPSNVFVGEGPKGPALITFWQRTPARSRPAIDIVNAAGEVVRHLRGSYQTDEGTKYWVSNAAGYNRLAWDGTEDGPVRWTGTTLQNAGPLTGAEALPGTYTVRLTVDGRAFTQPFLLRADPRNPWTAAELLERHDFLRRLFDDISQIDTLLNTIDAQERALHSRLDAASLVRMRTLDAVRATLTADDRRDEDSIAKPDRLREQIFGVIGSLSGSYQPPFAAHRAAAEAVQQAFDRTMASARASIGATSSGHPALGDTG